MSHHYLKQPYIKKTLISKNVPSKNVVVIYSGDDWHRKVPFKNDGSRLACEDLFKRGDDNSIHFYRASFSWFDQKSKTFSKSWAFRHDKWIKITKPIAPDVIRDKTSGHDEAIHFTEKMIINTTIPILDTPLFGQATDSKLKQYELFSKFMPFTELVKNEKELDGSLKKISRKLVVLKPLIGYGGDGIYIGPGNEVPKETLTYPLLAQEYIKSTVGIPGFSQKNEVCDLRLVYMNHHFIYAISRVAKENSHFTNYHQGASGVMVPDEKIPASVISMAQEIQKSLQIFPWVEYSLDFIFANDGTPVFIEMNSKPGPVLMYLVGDEKIRARHFKHLTEAIHSA